MAEQRTAQWTGGDAATDAAAIARRTDGGLGRGGGMEADFHQRHSSQNSTGSKTCRLPPGNAPMRLAACSAA
jgi:hypothetical protein